MENDPDLFLGVEEDGKPIGVIAYDGGKGWIAVDPAYRGIGLMLARPDMWLLETFSTLLRGKVRRSDEQSC